MFYWAMLLLAIITEVIGTSTIKLIGETYPVQGYFFLCTTIGLSYYFLSKAITHIPLGIAYATWEGMGIAFLTIIGYAIFRETISPLKIIGIITVIGGIGLLRYGSFSKKHKNIEQDQEECNE